ncbi:hypothetical protein Tco_1486238 [Tanacetum coccineum]
MESVSLSQSLDRWICDLSGDGEFRVKEVRNFIDNLFLPSYGGVSGDGGGIGKARSLSTSSSDGNGTTVGAASSVSNASVSSAEGTGSVIGTAYLPCSILDAVWLRAFSVGYVDGGS